MNTDFELLLVVKSSFHLAGRGHIHVVDFSDQPASIKVGDRVVAAIPGGGEIETVLTAVEFLDGRDNVSGARSATLGVMLEGATRNDPLPARTRIYRRGKGDKRP